MCVGLWGPFLLFPFLLSFPAAGLEQGKAESSRNVREYFTVGNESFLWKCALG